MSVSGGTGAASPNRPKFRSWVGAMIRTAGIAMTYVPGKR